MEVHLCQSKVGLVTLVRLLNQSLEVHATPIGFLVREDVVVEVAIAEEDEVEEVVFKQMRVLLT